MFLTIKLTDKYLNNILIKKINNFLLILFINNIHAFIKKKHWNLWKNYFTYTFILYFLRIIWRGKAYRVRLFKKHQKFTFNFGHSHWYKMIYFKTKLEFFRLRRQNYIVFIQNRFDLKRVKAFFNGIRTYNKYTRRGIRLKKSPYIRRFGKISQVNSILHSF